MAKIYKSETTCEFCKKSILWYAIVNERDGELVTYTENDVTPYRQVQIRRHNDKTALLRIRCKGCDKINDFSHTFSDD